MRHNEIHQRLRRTPQAELTGRISASAGVSATSLALDTRTPLSTYTLSRTVTVTSNGVPITTITSVPRIILDPVEYSSVSASEASARSSQTTASASQRESTAAATTSAKASNDGGNLTQLLPAIVVPIVVILVLSFAGFWFFMHRKHKKRLAQEPQFVMAKNVSRETSKSSRSSSTRELVPLSKLEKNIMVTTTEVRAPANRPNPPKYSSTDADMAQSIPPDKYMNANSRHTSRAIPNFSAPRPSTSHRNQGSHARGMNTGYNEAVTLPRKPPMARQALGYAMNEPYQGRSSTGSRSHHAQSHARHGAPPSGTNPDGPLRRADFAPMNSRNLTNSGLSRTDSSTPTGAFNGASSISQYSPIVKATNSLDHTIPRPNAAVQASPFSRPDHPGIDKMQRATGPAGSPVENVLSAENMRIARLANSSRLGSNRSPISDSPSFTFTTAGPLNQSPSFPLHVPDSRSFATTGRLPASPGASSSIYTTSTPAIGAMQSTRSLNIHGHNAVALGIPGNDHRVSVISQVSTNDGFEEIDAKSDVSSLDEREQWKPPPQSASIDKSNTINTAKLSLHHPESFNSRLNHADTSGYNSEFTSPIDAPARSSATGTVISSHNTNMRDRDSEGPFVLSRY